MHFSDWYMRISTHPDTVPPIPRRHRLGRNAALVAHIGEPHAPAEMISCTTIILAMIASALFSRSGHANRLGTTKALPCYVDSDVVWRGSNEPGRNTGDHLLGHSYCGMNKNMGLLPLAARKVSSRCNCALLARMECHHCRQPSFLKQMTQLLWRVTQRFEIAVRGNLDPFDSPTDIGSCT